MNQQHCKQVVKYQGKNIIYSQIASLVILFFPPLGGAFYVAGSIVYWPSLVNVNPYAGGVLFTIGSILLVMTDIAGSYLQPQFSLLRPLQNIGAFRSFWTLIGNLAFTVGSVYFLPNLPVLVGEDLFIIGSIFHIIPQILCVWGVCSLNMFTAPFYIKMIKFKKTLVYMSLFLVGGCICFIIGTFLFIAQQQQPKYLYKEGVVLFILGSIFFVIAPLLVLKMRKIRILDPLIKYHEQMYAHFLPRQNLIYGLIKQNISGNQSIVLSMDPSITVDAR